LTSKNRPAAAAPAAAELPVVRYRDTCVDHGPV